MFILTEAHIENMTAHSQIHAELASLLRSPKPQPAPAGQRLPAPRWRVTPALLALLAAGLTINTASCKKAGPAPAPPKVEVVAVEQRDVPIYREWVGTLEGNVNATISAQVSGYLLRQNYTEGQQVKKGDLLFEIDDRTYQAALDQAQAKLGKSELDVQRYTPLAKTQAISQQELDDAIQANLANQAAVDAARLNVQFCKILSPVDGVAGLANAQIGNLVGPGSGPLTTVVQIDPIRAYVSVDQKLLTQIQERMLTEGKELRGGSASNYQGPPLELILASGSVYPQPGRVRFANNQVDVKTGTIRVVGEFPNPQGLLLPGMFVRVRALLDTETNALLVPQKAVADMQGRNLVAVVGADNKVSIRPVSVGEQVGQQWVIRGPVKAGDRVVAEGIQKVRQDAIVNPVPLGEKTSSPAAQTGEKKP
jgi:membrane fusion protein (multidrug efflux system)